MDDEEEVEHTLYVNRQVQVYRIPPRPAAGGHRSGEWRVDDQIWSGRLRMLARGHNVELRLEDAGTGELFAMCPFTPATQDVAVEAAADSSRYYVLRVEDPGTRRHAFLGLGVGSRDEAFEFRAAMADHAKQCQREAEVHQAAAAAAAAGPGAAPAAGGAGGLGGPAAAAAAALPRDPAVAALYRDPGDLSLKEGQTILRRVVAGGGAGRAQADVQSAAVNKQDGRHARARQAPDALPCAQPPAGGGGAGQVQGAPCVIAAAAARRCPRTVAAAPAGAAAAAGGSPGRGAHRRGGSQQRRRPAAAAAWGHPACSGCMIGVFRHVASTPRPSRVHLVKRVFGPPRGTRRHAHWPRAAFRRVAGF